MSGFKIVVTGSRIISGGEAEEFIWQCLRIFSIQFPVAELVSGHALGVDQICEEWAKANGIPIAKNPEFYPDYKKYGIRRAPLIRNRLMVDYGDWVIGFLDLDSKTGTTRHTLAYAQEKNKLMYFFVRKNGHFKGNFHLKLEDVK